MIDEQIAFNQLDDNENAVWSLLLATDYLKVLAVGIVGEYCFSNFDVAKSASSKDAAASC